MSSDLPHILHIYKDVHPTVRGGIERHIDDLRRHVPAVVSDVLVASRGCSATQDREVAGGREVSVWQIGRALSTPLTAAYPNWIRRLRPNLVHLHMPNPTAEISALTMPSSVPLVVSYHADIFRQAWLLPIYGALIRRVLQRADAVICGTERLAAGSPFIREVASKTRVIPYAVDCREFDRSRVAPDDVLAVRSGENSRRVVAAGRLVYYKGFARLIDLADRIDAQLMIVGGGPLEADLRARIAGRENVVLTGTVSDRALRANLAAADVFVLPSLNRAESFGIATIEAQAMGLPAVVTDVGTGTVEAIEDGVTGFVVSASDDDALVRALNRLLHDKKLCTRMGDAGRRRVVERFDIRRIAEAHRELYRSLLRR